MISGEKPKIILTLAAIFLIGCVAGGAVVAAVKGRPRPPMFGNLTERHLDRMAEDLALSEDQIERLRPILTEISAATQEVRRSSMAEFARIYEEMTVRVEAELTPEQVEIFRARQEERRKRAESMLKHRMSDKPMGGPGRPDGGRKGDERPPPPSEPEPAPPPPPGGADVP